MAINKAFSDKLALLNIAIKDLGYADIDITSKEWGYDKKLATENNLNGLDALKCSDFPGVILPAGVCPMPKKK